MNDETLQASVKYGDTVGTVSADWKERKGLMEFAQAAEIDTDQFFPIGTNIFYGEAGVATVSVLAVKVNDVANTYDGIQAYIDANRTLPYVELRTELGLETLLEHLKRLDVVMTKTFEGIESYERLDLFEADL